eukprot:gene12907-biopygen4639
MRRSPSNGCSNLLTPSRYRKVHSSQRIIEWLQANPPPEKVHDVPVIMVLPQPTTPRSVYCPFTSCTPVPLCMPPQYHRPNLVHAYRPPYWWKPVPDPVATLPKVLKNKKNVARSPKLKKNKVRTSNAQVLTAGQPPAFAMAANGRPAVRAKDAQPLKLHITQQQRAPLATTGGAMAASAMTPVTSRPKVRNQPLPSFAVVPAASPVVPVSKRRRRT